MSELIKELVSVGILWVFIGGGWLLPLVALTPSGFRIPDSGTSQTTFWVVMASGCLFVSGWLMELIFAPSRSQHV